MNKQQGLKIILDSTDIIGYVQSLPATTLRTVGRRRRRRRRWRRRRRRWRRQLTRRRARNWICSLATGPTWIPLSVSFYHLRNFVLSLGNNLKPVLGVNFFSSFWMFFDFFLNFVLNFSELNIFELNFSELNWNNSIEGRKMLPGGY